MPFNRVRFLIRVAFTSVALIAASPFAHSPLPAQAQQSPPVLSIASSASDDATPILYAVHAGLFKKAGIDVDLSLLPSGSAVTTAVVGGAVNIGKGSLVGLMNAHLRRISLPLVAPGAMYDARTPYAELVVAADAPVRDGADLDNKTVGIPELNDFNQLVSSMWVDQNGGDSKTLKFVEIPNSAEAAAIAAHRIDAAVLLEPYLAEALATKRVKVIGHAYSAISNSFMFTGWFASADWARNHSDVLKTFIRVLGEATAYTNAHHAETVSLIADTTKIPTAVVQTMVRVDSALSLNPAQIQPLIDAAAKYKMISSAFPAKDLIFSDGVAK